MVNIFEIQWMILIRILSSIYLVDGTNFHLDYECINWRKYPYFIYSYLVLSILREITTAFELLRSSSNFFRYLKIDNFLKLLLLQTKNEDQNFRS